MRRRGRGDEGGETRVRRRERGDEAKENEGELREPRWELREKELGRKERRGVTGVSLSSLFLVRFKLMKNRPRAHHRKIDGRELEEETFYCGCQ